MRRAIGLLAVCALAAGCTVGGADDAPTFAPSYVGPNVEGSPGARLQPILPTPSLGSSSPGGSNNPGSSGSPGQPSPSPTGKQDPLVVATKLAAPVGLTILPDNTALVGERTTGRIVRVQPIAGKPVPTVRTLAGLDTSGDGGLLDLALSPNFDEDNLIYAYVTTPKDNRVVVFTLTGPVTTVLAGIPKGATGNTGRLLFTANGDLYVGTGDAGRPALAADPKSLAGKILRITDIGRPAAGNPTSGSPIYTTGHRRVDGLCATATGGVLEVEDGTTAAADEINLLDGGAYYGWPSARSPQQDALTRPPSGAGAPGGCAVLQSRFWITSLDGRQLVSAPVTTRAGAPVVGAFARPVLNGTYGRLRTVVAAKDGALWITTSNRDGQGKPVAADERVIRYVPDATGGGTNPV